MGLYSSTLGPASGTHGIGDRASGQREGDYKCGLQRSRLVVPPVHPTGACSRLAFWGAQRRVPIRTNWFSTFHLKHRARPPKRKFGATGFRRLLGDSRYSSATQMEARGCGFSQLVCARGLEGIVAKWKAAATVAMLRLFRGSRSRTRVIARRGIRRSCSSSRHFESVPL
jgi:hypothetical protein